jgi:hypothetical protein
MKITKEFYNAEIAPFANIPYGYEHGQRALNLGYALQRTHALYCEPMTQAGLCPEHCPSCVPSLQTTVNLAEAVNIAALFNWLLRNAMSLQRENTLKHKESRQSFETNENPWPATQELYESATPAR